MAETYESVLKGRDEFRAEVASLKKEVKELLSLVDGVKVIVELFSAEHKAQQEWKKEWLSKAEEALSDTERVRKKGHSPLTIKDIDLSEEANMI